MTKISWGRIFALGNERNTAQVVGHKENPIKPGTGSTSKGVNMSEALAAQLLKVLHDDGYDVSAMRFDDSGRILSIPKKET